MEWKLVVCQEKEKEKERKSLFSYSHKPEDDTYNIRQRYSEKNDDDRISGRFSRKHYDALFSMSHQQTLITSRNKHVAHLMKVGHKRNKAAEVIRSATGHFTTAHTPYIGLWGEIWWTKIVELAHLHRTGGGLMACDWSHSYTLIPTAMTTCSVFLSPLKNLWHRLTRAATQLSARMSQMLTVYTICHSMFFKKSVSI